MYIMLYIIKYNITHNRNWSILWAVFLYDGSTQIIVLSLCGDDIIISISSIIMKYPKRLFYFGYTLLSILLDIRLSEPGIVSGICD